VSTVDPVVKVLADLDHPATPTAEFQDALLVRLLAELRPAAEPRPREGRLRGVHFLPGVLWRHGRRRRVIALAAALLVVVVGTATAIGGVRAFILDNGFIGLPPVGARPSAPESGELEIFYWVNWAANGTEGRTRGWVYADGRLIRHGAPSDPAESANPLSTGFLEQRLTPEGVERLRSEILSTGEFGYEPSPPAPPPPCPKGQSPSDRKKAIASGDCQLPTPPPDPNKPLTIGFATTVEVAGHGRLVRVDRAREYFRLEARLSDPAAWLPASAWVDRDVRAYVSSKYAVCYSGWPPDQPVERSRLLALLPPAVRDTLEDARPRQGPLFGEPGNFRPSYEYCSELTTDDARAIAVGLDNAGFHESGASRLHYRLEAPGSDPGGPGVWFEPYLPHGDIVCTVCG
jgi:hypothetical protein